MRKLLRLFFVCLRSALYIASLGAMCIVILVFVFKNEEDRLHQFFAVKNLTEFKLKYSNQILFCKNVRNIFGAHFTVIGIKNARVDLFLRSGCAAVVFDEEGVLVEKYSDLTMTELRKRYCE